MHWTIRTTKNQKTYYCCDYDEQLNRTMWSSSVERAITFDAQHHAERYRRVYLSNRKDVEVGEIAEALS